MTWQYGDWRVPHDLPIGVSERVSAGQQVRAGDTIAAGAVYGSPLRIAGARRLGVAAHDLGRVMRVAVGAEVAKGTVIARTGRRFARAVSAPIDGRILHLRDDGDVYVAPIVDRWIVRSTMDGIVSASTDNAIVVDGGAWCLQGVAAYGPDAIGELSLAVTGPSDEIVPSRVDVTQRGRILVAGGRGAAESIARAHACGVAAVVAGAVPAAGLRAVFGDDVTAHSSPSHADAPTVLCLVGFGSAQLPPSVFAPLQEFGRARAAVHTASARLFVFAPPAAVAVEPAPSLALVADWTAIRQLDGPTVLGGEIRFASERAARAVASPDGPIPAANVLPLGSPR